MKFADGSEFKGHISSDSVGAFSASDRAIDVPVTGLDARLQSLLLDIPDMDDVTALRGVYLISQAQHTQDSPLTLTMVAAVLGIKYKLSLPGVSSQ